MIIKDALLSMQEKMKQKLAENKINEVNAVWK